MKQPGKTPKALVTGSAGFLGRHFSRELRSRGWDVYGVDPSGAQEERPGAYSGDSGITKWQHSLYWKSDAIDLFSSGVRMRFDLVVHAAAVEPHRVAIDGTNMNFAKNLQLDSAMFDWAVRTGQRRVLYLSSSAVYPAAYQTQYSFRRYESISRLRETDTQTALAPFDNYGWGKLMGERMAKDAREAGLAVTVVRPFSGYGEDQTTDFPFPAIASRAVAGDLSVWGPPGQTRDWIHVEDVVRGALAIVDSGTTDPVNLCTGEGTEMGDLARAFFQRAHWDGKLWRELDREPIYDESKPTGVFYRVGDPTRMSQYYTPQVSLEEGVERMVHRLTEEDHD